MDHTRIGSLDDFTMIFTGGNREIWKTDRDSHLENDLAVHLWRLKSTSDGKR